jgi:hypothetical protein
MAVQYLARHPEQPRRSGKGERPLDLQSNALIMKSILKLVDVNNEKPSYLPINLPDLLLFFSPSTTRLFLDHPTTGV